MINLYLSREAEYFANEGGARGRTVRHEAELVAFIEWAVRETREAYPEHEVGLCDGEHLVGVDTDDEWNREEIVEFCGTLLERYDKQRGWSPRASDTRVEPEGARSVRHGG